MTGNTTTPRPIPREQATIEPPRRRARTRLAGALAALVLVTGGAACGESGEVPEQIRDRWVAESGRYSGVVVEITCRRVLVDGPGGFLSHLITQAEASRSRDGMRYDLELLIDGGRQDLLQLDSDRAGQVLRLRNGGDSRFVRRPDHPTSWDGWASDCPS